MACRDLGGAPGSGLRTGIRSACWDLDCVPGSGVRAGIWISPHADRTHGKGIPLRSHPRAPDPIHTSAIPPTRAGSHSRARLKYDLSRERHSSQLSWIRSVLVMKRQHAIDCEHAEKEHRARLRPRALRENGFKASTQKKKETLRFVATNLHSQRLDVYASGQYGAPGMGSASLGSAAVGPAGAGSTPLGSGLTASVSLGTARAADGPTPIASYCHVTLGAPAAHSLGFKDGGIWQVQERMTRCWNEINQTDGEEHKRWGRGRGGG